MLELYNTLSKKVEPVEKRPHLNLYSCGPTVYNYAHIGNLRSFIMADLLYRTLKDDGYNPRWAMNITDIDDKTIKGAIAEFGDEATVKDLFDFTEIYLQAFRKDLEEVRISVDEIDMYRVTDKMKEIQEFIISLVKKKYGYVTDDGIYFSIEKYQNDFGDYGELVGHKFLEGKKVGARVQVDEYEKDNLSDFALWKNHNQKTDANIFWPDLAGDKDVRFPNGRPGWHIECSVINKVAFKGEPTDIHTGGVDLIFPHHTNEIAQSQPFYKPFSRLWHHNEHLLVDGSRMGKRFDNFYTIKDLMAKGFSGQDLRYFYFSSSFLSQQNFTFEALAAARSAREKIFGLASQSPQNPQALKEAISDNLNAPKALSALWSGNLTEQQIASVLGFEQEQLQILSPEIQKLFDLRAEAREAKDFSKSDQLRKQIEDLGYEIMDTQEGQKIKRKIQV
jgi:cysteinyl-tRNA synthetase